MPNATQPFDAPQRPGRTLCIGVAAATTLFAGTIAALDAAGNIVPAADTAGLRALGRIEFDADNATGLAGDITAQVSRGVFRYANSVANAIDAGDIGKLCYVEDDHTVATTTDHLVKAGRIVAVDADGVWVEFGHDSNIVPSADTLTALTFTGGGATGPEVEALRDAMLALLQAQGLSL